MKKIVFSAVAVCAFAVAAFAQTTNVSDKFVISAKAGGVNAVVGEVLIERSNGRTGHLFKGDEVQIGEKVTTGADGKAEVLMNPGSYVRLGPKSSFEFVSTDLDNVQLKMHSGSAILEILGTEDFNVELSTDTARFTIVQSGVYRIDAAEKGSSVVAVWRGKLRAGNETKASVGKGKVVEFNGASYTVAKFDRDTKDELATWSNERARGLSQLSASLRPDRLRNSLINSFYGNQWNFYNSFGLWVFDPFARSFCFLPFGWGWQSPYGFGFGRPIWFYNLPRTIYNQSPPIGTTVGRTTIPVDPTPRGNPGKVGDVDASPSIFKGASPAKSDTGIITAPRSEPIIVAPAPSKNPGKQP